MLFVYLTQARNIPLPDAGAVISLYGLGALFGVTIGGALADKIGRRWVMLVSLSTSAAFMLVLGATTSLTNIAIATFCLGLITDLYRPASQALIADVVPPEHRMKAFGLQYWAVNLGISFAALVGGYMAKRNFAVLFWGDAATTLVLFLIVLVSIPESRPKEARTEKAGHALTPFFDRRFSAFLILNYLVAFVFFQHLFALPEDMRQKGLDTTDFGVAVATNCICIVLFQPLVTRWVKSIARSHLLSVASALTGIGFGATIFATSLPTYMATVVVWTFAEILFAPVNASIVADLSPTHLRGRYQGAFSLTWALAGMSAPALSTRIIPATSLRTFWLLCLGIGLFAALAHAIFTARILQRVDAVRVPQANA